VQIALPQQSCAPFANLIFEKFSGAVCFFYKPFEVQIELSLQSCALFVDNFCRPNPKPASTETTLPEKTGFRA
jgi:hypothetical protein